MRTTTSNVPEARNEYTPAAFRFILTRRKGITEKVLLR